MYWDPTLILVIIGALICAVASFNVKTTFSRFSNQSNARRMTGRDAAEAILHNAGIYDVTIELEQGHLTDHYSPKEKVLRLSSSVYGSTSIAAIGVAAHECGHAIQHQEQYLPLNLRSIAVPVANIGSALSWPIIVIGVLLGFMGLARIGVFLFSFVVLFQLITLPVEFNASRRALRILRDTSILSDNELVGAKKVLSAAALTYVAALFSSILQLLRLALYVRGNDRD
ncbi:MAG: zinc metallopeptidase [Acutalibacteraceae bacterium]|nr:zinc metallopeptidase [Acutalibacteraceae bacterium]